MSDKKEVKIFIIEDDFIFIEILVNILESINSEFKYKNLKLLYQTFYSAKEAEFEFSQNPDIVLLDYFIMDDELRADTGTKVIKDIKEKNLNIDVIIVSGQESPVIKQQLLSDGAYAYISKDEKSLSQLKPLLIKLINERLER
ncbi:MAG: response regulator [Bacteroidales bacterium]|nr:response regulator [Bacteroidales bacterium]MBN2755960.1 response regulator [Bacteroidales bacterium]